MTVSVIVTETRVDAVRPKSGNRAVTASQPKKVVDKQTAALIMTHLLIANPILGTVNISIITAASGVKMIATAKRTVAAAARHPLTMIAAQTPIPEATTKPAATTAEANAVVNTVPLTSPPTNGAAVATHVRIQTNRLILTVLGIGTELSATRL